MTSSNIVNCFAKARISKEQHKSAKFDDDDPFKDLQNIRKLDYFYLAGTTAEVVISTEENKVMNDSSGDDEEDDGEAVLGPYCSKASDARDALPVQYE